MSTPTMMQIQMEMTTLIPDTHANLYLPASNHDDSYNARTNTRTHGDILKNNYICYCWRHCFTRTRLSLCVDLEVQYLNSLYQCVRAELLELFVLPGSTSASISGSQNVGTRTGSPEDSFSSPKSFSTRSFRKNMVNNTSPPDSTFTSISPPTISASHRQYPWRVGIRCVYCAKFKKAFSGSSFYPKNIAFKTVLVAFLLLKRKNISVLKRRIRHGGNEVLRGKCKSFGLVSGHGQKVIVFVC